MEAPPGAHCSFANARFKAVAEEVGIEVTQDPRLGWSPNTLRQSTRDTYTAAVAQLGRALQRHRAPEAARGGRKDNNNAIARDGTAAVGSAFPAPCSPPDRSPVDCAVRTSSGLKAECDRAGPRHGALRRSHMALSRPRGPGLGSEDGSPMQVIFSTVRGSLQLSNEVAAVVLRRYEPPVEVSPALAAPASPATPRR
jgi:hypothetical protein